MNEEEFDYPPSVTEERLFMPGYGKITAYKIQKTGLDKLWDVEVGEGNCTTPAIAYGGYVIMFRHNPTKKSFNMDRKMILVFDKLDEGIEKMEYNISALPITIGVDKHLIE